MSHTRYTSDHEWIRDEGDGIATVGITDYAQQQLGDVVFVELPPVGRELAPGDDAAVIESVKAAAEVKAPVAGRVTDANAALADEPQRVNLEPEAGGWFFRMQLADPAALGSLMDAEAYQAYVQTLG